MNVIHKLHLSINMFILKFNFINLLKLWLITVNDNKVVFIILYFILRILIKPIHYHCFDWHYLEWFLFFFVDVLLETKELIFQKIIFFILFLLWFLPKWNWKVYVILGAKVFMEETKQFINATNFRVFLERLRFGFLSIISAFDEVIEFINIDLFNFLLLTSNEIKRV